MRKVNKSILTSASATKKEWTTTTSAVGLITSRRCRQVGERSSYSRNSALKIFQDHLRIFLCFVCVCGGGLLNPKSNIIWLTYDEELCKLWLTYDEKCSGQFFLLYLLSKNIEACLMHKMVSSSSSSSSS